MKQSTIKRIEENARMGKNTIIGKYTYKTQEWTDNIIRCKTDDIGRMWLTWDGKRVDGWEIVVER